jgi:alanine racemase
MNSIAVDITDVPKAEANDEVVLIGRQQRSELSVASFSEHANQLNYELLTRLPRDIPRIIIS